MAQLGARRHYAVPVLLKRGGVLETFYTDFYAKHSYASVIEKAVRAGWNKSQAQQMLSRRHGELPEDKVACFPAFAIWNALTKGTSKAQCYRRWLKANRRFGRLVCSRGLGTADTVYVFNGAGLEILEAARGQGLRCIVDQTDAPVSIEESLLSEEREAWPDWEVGGVQEAVWKSLAEREQAEWDLADVIVCGSTYVHNSVAAAAGPNDRCRVVPYGIAQSGAIASQTSTSSRPLRVLFAGTLCLRKGIQYLWQTAQHLDRLKFDIRTVGPSQLTQKAVARLSKTLQVTGTVPRSEMQRQYEWADVLVLPSVSEGSANVCYEALAAGVPVITTPHAGSVVRDQVDGFVVPIRDADSLANALERLAGDTELLRCMSESALSRAGEFSWDSYSARLMDAIRDGPRAAGVVSEVGPT